jgi:hypothetical protein
MTWIDYVFFGFILAGAVFAVFLNWKEGSDNQKRDEHREAAKADIRTWLDENPPLDHVRK